MILYFVCPECNFIWFAKGSPELNIKMSSLVCPVCFYRIKRFSYIH